jgi:hypothetical protein
MEELAVTDGTKLQFEFSSVKPHIRYKTLFRFFSLFALSTFVWVDNVYAYLDPGVGSMLLQSLVAAVAGGLFLIKTYWDKLKVFFSRDKTKTESKD